MSHGYDESYQEIDLMEMLAVLWKRKIMIALLTVFAIISGYVASKLMDPVYEASLTVQLRDPVVRNDFTPRTPTVDEVTRFLQDPSVIQAVHEETGIGQSWEKLRGLLSVEKPSNTSMVVLKASANTPEDSVRLVQAWSQVAAKRFNDGAVKGLSAILLQLQKELASAEKELAAAREEWKNFSKSSEIEMLTKRIEALTTLLAEYEGEEQSLISSIGGLEAELSVLQEEIGKINPWVEESQRPKGSEQTAVNPVYQAIYQQLIETRSELYGAKSRLEAIKRAKEQMERQIAEAQVILAEQSVESERLKSRLEQLSERYDQAYTNYEAARLVQTVPVTYLTAVCSPVPPETPVKPRTMLNVAISGFLALFVGVGLAFFLEYLEAYRSRVIAMDVEGLISARHHPAETSEA